MSASLVCLQCGLRMKAPARFCSGCGAQLSAPAPEHELRKTVSVVFCDVCGSTGLGERLDPEVLRHVLRRFYAEMRSVLESHGGSVEKFIGDAVVAVFGVPVAHEDDALRAARAATEMRAALARLNDELEREHGVRLEIRTAVNTGAAIAGDLGIDASFTSGDVVNVAARLEQAALPGEILVGAATRALLGDAAEAEPVAPLKLRGKDEPVTAFRLLETTDRQAARPPFETAFVGRRSELALLHTAFTEAVAEPGCRLVTVVGEAGIGKTRLVAEFTAGLRGPTRLVTGRCLPYGRGITYRPLAGIVRSLGGPGVVAEALAGDRHAPLVRELILGAIGGAQTVGSVEETQWAVRRLFEALARERPLVVVLEDLHWAEPTFLELVEYLVGWTRGAPLLLLAAAREELFDARPAWALPRPGCQILALRPLSGEESDALIGLAARRRLPEEARTRIAERGAGNPLFLEQLLVYEMGSSGDAGKGPLPATINALLAARLDALPLAERDLLERAAIEGVTFHRGTLTALLPPERREEAATHLLDAVRHNLIRPHPADLPDEDGFRFVHVLVHEAVYESMPKELRGRLHERFADCLDDRADGLDELVGHHLEQAYRCLADLGLPAERARGLAERAAAHLAAPGRRAFARGDMPAAANLLERAVRLYPRRDSRRLALLPSLGRALMEGLDWERAGVVLEEAVELGWAIGEPSLAADASVALCWRRAHDSGQNWEEIAGDLENATRVLEEHGCTAGLARAISVASVLRFWRGEADAAIVGLERAARLAHEAGDRPQEVESLRIALMAARNGPVPVDAIARRLEKIAGDTEGNRKLELAALVTRSYVDSVLGRFDAARARIAEAEALAEELGLQQVLAAEVHREAGQIELRANDPAAAERRLRPACERLEQSGDSGHFVSHASLLADAVARQGRPEEAARLLERIEAGLDADDLEAQILWRRARIRIALRSGSLGEAERLAREATALAAPTDYLDLRGEAAVDLGEVLRAAGRCDGAAAALGEAVRLFARKGNAVGAARARAALEAISSGSEVDATAAPPSVAIAPG